MKIQKNNFLTGSHKIKTAKKTKKGKVLNEVKDKVSISNSNKVKPGINDTNKLPIDIKDLTNSISDDVNKIDKSSLSGIAKEVLRKTAAVLLKAALLPVAVAVSIYYRIKYGVWIGNLPDIP